MKKALVVLAFLAVPFLVGAATVEEMIQAEIARANRETAVANLVKTGKITVQDGKLVPVPAAPVAPTTGPARPE